MGPCEPLSLLKCAAFAVTASKRDEGTESAYARTMY